MRLHSMMAVLLAATAVTGARAQQARTPSTRATVVPANTSMTVTLSVRGANAEKYLTVNANNADVRDLVREMAKKAGVNAVVASSATGRITGMIDGEPIEKAMSTVAAMAQLSIRKIVVPEASATSLTADSAGRLAEALASLPVDASVTDPATGKTLLVKTAEVAPAAGQTVVYYLQGKLTPEQERLAREQRVLETAKANTAANPAAQGAVTSAVQALNQLPIADRMQAMRQMQRQMWENMSPQDRQAMRDSFRQNRDQRWQGTNGDHRNRRG